MNISIAIVDSNDTYRERLSVGLERYKELKLSIFSTVDKLIKSVNNKKIDVVLFDPDIINEKLVISNARLMICLCDEASNNAMFYDESVPKIAKYQRVSEIYRVICDEYANKIGGGVSFTDISKIQTIMVYSPIGGAGKTILAYLIAAEFAKKGIPTLYLSFEMFSSAEAFLPKEDRSIVELFEILDKNVNFELKLKSAIRKSDEGVYYLSGFTKMADYCSVTADEIKVVLNNIKATGLFERIVIDTSSVIDNVARTVSESSDHMVLVEKPGEIAKAKLTLFAEQPFYQDNLEKMVSIINFAESSTLKNSLLNLQSIGMIHNQGNLQMKSIIQSVLVSKSIDVGIL